MAARANCSQPLDPCGGPLVRAGCVAVPRDTAAAVFAAVCTGRAARDCIPLAQSFISAWPEYSVYPRPENGPSLAGEKGSRSRALDTTLLTALATRPAMVLMPLIRPWMICLPALYSHRAAPDRAPVTLPLMLRITLPILLTADVTADLARLIALVIVVRMKLKAVLTLLRMLLIRVLMNDLMAFHAPVRNDLMAFQIDTVLDRMAFQIELIFWLTQFQIADALDLSQFHTPSRLALMVFQTASVMALT